MYTQSATRRDFLRYGVTGTTALMIGCSTAEKTLLRKSELPAPPQGATFVGKIPFMRRNRRERLEEVYGVGWSGRFRQDLSLLTPETLITSNERFYIRTRCPTALDLSLPWSIEVGGASGEIEERPVETVISASRSMGVHLLECSGNGGSFGLLSAAEWSGVPLAEFLALEGVQPPTEHLLISGFDEHPETTDPRVLGANWIYRWQDLIDAGAFLATGMNGVPLPPDHGYPVRLVVPGWYGCTCIKWVNEIRFVGPDELSTAHMREFAGRTEQSTAHERAADYAAALIDLTAVPIRVEQWQLEGEPFYRLVGVLWGGRQLTEDLRIELGADTEAVPVDYFSHEDYRTWSLWSHIWRPASAGVHQLRMQVGESEIRTRRLDRGFYRQRVEILAI